MWSVEWSPIGHNFLHQLSVMGRIRMVRRVGSSTDIRCYNRRYLLIEIQVDQTT